MSWSDKYDLVIFDCDGTLVHSEVMINNAFADVLKGMGVTHYSSQECNRIFHGMSLDAVLAYIKKDIGIQLDAQEIEKRFHPIFNNVTRTGMVPVDGADEFIQFLKNKKIDICVASNGDRSAVIRALEMTNLKKYFEDKHIFTYQQVDYGKPAPDLFLYAADNMWADYQKCLVVEDSVIGVTAAKKANMDVVVVNTAGHDVKSQISNLQPKAIVNDLMEIVPFLS